LTTTDAAHRAMVLRRIRESVTEAELDLYRREERREQNAIFREIDRQGEGVRSAVSVVVAEARRGNREARRIILQAHGIAEDGTTFHLAG